jgi:hypothetical protein
MDVVVNVVFGNLQNMHFWSPPNPNLPNPHGWQEKLPLWHKSVGLASFLMGIGSVPGRQLHFSTTART